MADDLVPTDTSHPAGTVTRRIRRRPTRAERVVSTVRETSPGGRTHRSGPGSGADPADPTAPAGPARSTTIAGPAGPTRSTTIADPAGPAVSAGPGTGAGPISAAVAEGLAARLGGGELLTVGQLAVLAGVDPDRYGSWLDEDRFGLSSLRRLAVGPVGDGPTGPVDVVWWRPPAALEGPVDEWEPVAVQWHLEGPAGFGPVIVGHRYPAPSHRPDSPDPAWPPVLDACRRLLVGQGLAVHRFDGADVIWTEAAGSDDHWELWVRSDEDGGGAEAVSLLPDPVPADTVDRLAALADDLLTDLGRVEVRWEADRRPEVRTATSITDGDGACDPVRLERMVALNLAVADELVPLVRQAAGGA